MPPTSPSRPGSGKPVVPGAFPASLNDAGRKVEDALAAFGESLEGQVPSELLAPARYALAGEGKRLRPILTVLVYEALGGVGDIAPLSIPVEIIHTYSLVHDDLPCMDDDDVRRGRPTTHREYSARQAMLAGAALIPLAGRTVFAAGKKLGYTEEKCGAIARALFQGAGAGGMIGGQLADLSAEGRRLAQQEMETVHAAKTGELILAAARMGAIAADASPDQMLAVEKFARSLGLAFQIMDDVLDETSSTETLGKTAGRDVALGKSTYVSLLGLDAARGHAEELVTEGVAALSERGILTAKLLEVANFILARNA